MTMGLQMLGIAVQAAGLAILYLHWRAKRGLGGLTLVGGWALIGLGAIPWLLNVSIERGLAIAMLAPMMAGLFLLAPDALARVGDGAARKKKMQAPPLEAEDAIPGVLSRNIARWLGALVAAPAFGVAAMAAWQAFAPTADVNRIAFSIFALMIGWTAALLWLLASVRPWLAAFVTSVSAIAIGGGAYLFALGGPV